MVEQKGLLESLQESYGGLFPDRIQGAPTLYELGVLPRTKEGQTKIGDQLVDVKIHYSGQVNIRSALEEGYTIYIPLEGHEEEQSVEIGWDTFLFPYTRWPLYKVDPTNPTKFQDVSVAETDKIPLYYGALYRDPSPRQVDIKSFDIPVSAPLKAGSPVTDSTNVTAVVFIKQADQRDDNKPFLIGGILDYIQIAEGGEQTIDDLIEQREYNLTNSGLIEERRVRAVEFGFFSESY